MDTSKKGSVALLVLLCFMALGALIGALIGAGITANMPAQLADLPGGRNTLIFASALMSAMGFGALSAKFN